MILRHIFSKLIYFFIISILINANSGYSEEDQTSVELMKQRKYENQFHIGLSSNFPIDKTYDNYENGTLTLQLEYSSFLPENWMLGFGGGFQSLKNRETGKSLAIAKIYQRSRKLYRIYHPLYFGVGFELSYLFPASSQELIPELEAGFSTEFGAGFTNALIFRLSDSSMLTLNINVWRGTGSRKIQAVETGIMFGKAL